MNRVVVSIVIPVYNSEAFLADTIQSVISQSFIEWELILVDDGSTDGSGRICDSFAENECRIRVFHQKNSGVSAARNCGIKVSNGEYIVFLDSDDMIEPYMLEKLLLNMDESDLVVCSMKNMGTGKGIHIVDNLISFHTIEETKPCFESLYENGFFNSPVNKMYRKERITDLFPLDMSLGEDLIFNLRYLKNIEKKIVAIPDELYLYRTDVSDSLSKKVRVDLAQIWARMISEFGLAFANDYYIMRIVKKRCIETINYKVINWFSKSKERLLRKELLHSISSSPLVQIITVDDLHEVSFLNSYLWRLLINHHYWTIHVLSKAYGFFRREKRIC